MELFQSLLLWRLDYGNASLPNTGGFNSITDIQRLFMADLVNLLFCPLHWLQVEQHVILKVAVLTYSWSGAYTA